MSFSRGGRSRTLVGLDVQPGYVAAVQARVNGSVAVERAAGLALPADTVREGEVLDERLLAESVRELFGSANLDRRVRVGVANQRTVLRTLELPPIDDRKELAAAVRFQAEDQMPMPLSGAVLDFHSLGTVDTPNGVRQRVVVVAAQRDMVEKLLNALREAGLRPEGVDLSAFALIRSLYRPAAPAADGAAERTLYLNVGGLTNMAIAEGTTCVFTRMVGGGLESMASEVAERRGIKLVEARELLAQVDLARAVEPEPLTAVPEAAPATEAQEGVEGAQPFQDAPAPAAESPESALPARPAPAEQPEPQPADPGDATGAEARAVLERGVREIAGDVRNSLDFFHAQGGGAAVAGVVLSGPALGIAGFARALQDELGFNVESRSVRADSVEVGGGLSAEHLAVAAGLAVEEVGS